MESKDPDVELDEGKVVGIFVSDLLEKVKTELEIENRIELNRKRIQQKEGLSIKERISLFQSNIPYEIDDVGPQSEAQNQENQSRGEEFRRDSKEQEENEIDLKTKYKSYPETLLGGDSVAYKDIHFDADVESGKEIENISEEKMGREASGEGEMVFDGSAEEKNEVNRQIGEEKPKVGVQRHPLIDAEGDFETEQFTQLKMEPEERKNEQKEVIEIEMGNGEERIAAQIEQEEAKNSSNKIVEEDKETLNEVNDDELDESLHEVQSAMAEKKNYNRSKDTMDNSSCIEISASSCEAELDRILFEPASHEFGPDLSFSPKSATELQADSLIREAILTGEFNFAAHNAGEDENTIEENDTDQNTDEAATSKKIEENNSTNKTTDKVAKPENIEENKSTSQTTEEVATPKNMEENASPDQTTDEVAKTKKIPPPTLPKPKINQERRGTVYVDPNDESSDSTPGKFLLVKLFFH